MNNDILPSEKESNRPEAIADEKSHPSKVENQTDIDQMPDAIALQHWEFLLAELVGLIGLFVAQSVSANGVRTTEVLFDSVVRLWALMASESLVGIHNDSY